MSNAIETTDGKFLRESEAAALLQVSTRTMQDWRMRGAGPPYIRISGRCIRYRVGDLCAWASERVATSTSATTEAEASARKK